MFCLLVCLCWHLCIWGGQRERGITLSHFRRLWSAMWVPPGLLGGAASTLNCWSFFQSQTMSSEVKTVSFVSTIMKPEHGALRIIFFSSEGLLDGRQVLATWVSSFWDSELSVCGLFWAGCLGTYLVNTFFLSFLNIWFTFSVVVQWGWLIDLNIWLFEY